MLRKALREYGLPDEVSEIPVTDCAQAEALAFPGSPTIRINGRDIESELPAQGNYALSCRTFIVDGKRQGVPSPDMIRRAIGATAEFPHSQAGIVKYAQRAAPAGAAISALFAATCCLPLGISAAAGAAGLGVVIEPLRPWLIVLSIALLAIGFVSLYRSKRTCQQRSRARIALFWVSAIVVVAAVLFPQILASFLADVLP